MSSSIFEDTLSKMVLTASCTLGMERTVFKIVFFLRNTALLKMLFRINSE